MEIYASILLTVFLNQLYYFTNLVSAKSFIVELNAKSLFLWMQLNLKRVCEQLGWTARYHKYKLFEHRQVMVPQQECVAWKQI